MPKSNNKVPIIIRRLKPGIGGARDTLLLEDGELKEEGKEKLCIKSQLLRQSVMLSSPPRKRPEKGGSSCSEIKSTQWICLIVLTQAMSKITHCEREREKNMLGWSGPLSERRMMRPRAFSQLEARPWPSMRYARMGPNRRVQMKTVVPSGEGFLVRLT